MQVVGDPEHAGGLGVDRQLVIVGHRLELRGRLGQHLGQVDRMQRVLAPDVGSGEQQQVADQTAHPPGRAQRRLRGLRLLAAELLGEELEVGQDAGQRRPQLV